MRLIGVVEVWMGLDMYVGHVKRIERFALLGAHGDPRIDKSDWIRIWAMARHMLGRTNDAATWQKDYDLAPTWINAEPGYSEASRR